jgi:anti-sigma regulatory factor (Ser/Thr protein kinase)
MSERLLADFSLASQPGNERVAMQRVVEAIRSLALPSEKLQRLETAVAEATLNAMEHGNHFQDGRPVTVRVLASDTHLCVTVIDLGGANPIPIPQTPDINAKLAGRQSPRGWGLFLIKKMVDEVSDESDGHQHTVCLRVRLD